jgi:hypothetical protein
LFLLRDLSSDYLLRLSLKFRLMIVIALVLSAAVVAARPFVTVPMCHLHSGDYQITEFQLDDSSRPAPSSGQTSARLCVADDTLHVHWRSVDDNVISNFLSCNDPLYKQDAVEIFLALDSPQAAPYRYVEFEVSPFGVLFNSLITNPSGSCTTFSGTPLSCAGTGVHASAARTANGWTADLAIPLSFLELELGINVLNSTIYGNLFRIDLAQSGAKTYSAWVPTDASPPCFHKPQYFTSLQLQPKKAIPPTTTAEKITIAKTTERSSTRITTTTTTTTTRTTTSSSNDNDASSTLSPTSANSLSTHFDLTSSSSSQAQFNFFLSSFDRFLQPILIAALLHTQV